MTRVKYTSSKKKKKKIQLGNIWNMVIIKMIIFLLISLTKKNVWL